MDTLKRDFINIYRSERSILVLMALNFLLALGLLIFAFINLNPNSSVVKTGYGDIGGYRDGTWIDLLAFPLLAVIFGVIHSFIAVRIFHKRGGGMAKFFLITTAAIILATALVLIRLLGEG